MTPMTVTLSAIYLNRMKEFSSIWIGSFVFAWCVVLQVIDATCESTVRVKPNDRALPFLEETTFGLNFSSPHGEIEKLPHELTEDIVV